MNAINYRVSLDMFDVSSQVTIKCKKGDSACKIHITLTENGKIYNITEGCYATFSAKKSDGNVVHKPSNCTIEGNTIVYDFANSIDEEGNCQVSACEGNVDCEVALYKGDKKLTSPHFNLFVDGTVYNGEEIHSTDMVEEFRVDQTYLPESKNAQSGKAVAEALTNHYTKDECGNIFAQFDSRINEALNYAIVTDNKIGSVAVDLDNNYYTKEEVNNLDAVKYVTQVAEDELTIMSPIGNALITLNDNDNVTIQSENDIDVLSSRIINVQTPTDNTDAATKGYVDNALANVDLTNYVRKTDYAGVNRYGVVKTNPDNGINVNSSGELYIEYADNATIDAKKTRRKPITPYMLDYAVKKSITTNTETLTDAEKSVALEWLGAAPKSDWELIEDITLTENVAAINISLPTLPKEIYVEAVMHKPTDYNGGNLGIFFQYADSKSGGYRGVLADSNRFDTEFGIVSFQGTMGIAPSGKITTSGQACSGEFGYTKSNINSCMEKNLSQTGTLSTFRLQASPEKMGIGSTIKVWGR